MVLHSDPRAKPTARAERPSWIAGCCAGEPTAVAAMFSEYCETVERVIYRLVGATPDLEDLVQTTFIEAMRSIQRYRGEASFKTWITSIAVHVAHCLLYTSPSPRDGLLSRMPSSA